MGIYIHTCILICISNWLGGVSSEISMRRGNIYRNLFQAELRAKKAGTDDTGSSYSLGLCATVSKFMLGHCLVSLSHSNENKPRANRSLTQRFCKLFALSGSEYKGGSSLRKNQCQKWRTENQTIHFYSFCYSFLII